MIMRAMSATSSFVGRSGAPAAARWVSLLVWLVLALSVTYWVLQWQEVGGLDSTSSTRPVAADDALSVGHEPATMGKALGAAGIPVERAAAPALASRLVLVGVVRAGSRDGAALIAVDGKPARSVRLRAEVEPGLYLVSLEARRASLGPDPQGPESLVLELPKPKLP